MWVELALVSVWLAGLTVTSLAVKRETVLVDLSASHLDRVPAGPAIGAPVPRSLSPPGERRIVVFLDSGCPPCHELAAQLNEVRPLESLTIAISGEAREATDMLAAIPSRATVLVGSEAASAVDSVHVSYQPFALAVADGIVVAKAYPTSAESLSRLFDEDRRR